MCPPSWATVTSEPPQSPVNTTSEKHDESRPVPPRAPDHGHTDEIVHPTFPPAARAPLAAVRKR